jgi:uncharacterized membrane protein
VNQVEFVAQQSAPVPGWAVALLLACQAALAVALSLMAHLGAAEKLPRNAFFGLRTGRSRADDASWRHVHREAAPLVRAAGAAAVVGLVVLALTTGAQGVFLAVLVVTDLVVLVLVGLASVRGHRDLPAG